MKLIIAGGRDYQLTEADYAKLNDLHHSHKVALVISGTASGADSCGEFWAEVNNISVERHRPDWERWGKFAGILRNTDMAVAADALAVFPGGKGTANMLKQAQERGLRVFDFRT